MKKELLLFITSNYTNVNKNLLNNTYNLFDEVKLLNENDLDNYISKIINLLIDKYGNKGYGFWLWKSYLLINELNKLNENDIFVYLDSHCIDDNLKNKFNDIIEELNSQSIIISRLGFNDLQYTTTKLKNHIEKCLNYKFTDEQLNDIQYEAGIVFIKNCDESRKFIKQWFNIMISNLNVITDIYNNDNDNHKTFVANRHDQSVVSLLYKFYNYKTPKYLNWGFMHIK